MENKYAQLVKLLDDQGVLQSDNHWAEPIIAFVKKNKPDRNTRAQPIQGGEAVALTVWYGPMPESNGKSNFTAILMRKGADLFDGIAGGITIARSEYPDRVRYEADRMRYLIGELDAEPDILAYDGDLHSGYTHPAAQVADGVVVSRDLLQDLRDLAFDQVEHHRAAMGAFKQTRQSAMDSVLAQADALLRS